jgi:hypothetical protein
VIALSRVLASVTSGPLDKVESECSVTHWRLPCRLFAVAMNRQLRHTKAAQMRLRRLSACRSALVFPRIRARSTRSAAQGVRVRTAGEPAIDWKDYDPEIAPAAKRIREHLQRGHGIQMNDADART